MSIAAVVLLPGYYRAVATVVIEDGGSNILQAEGIVDSNTKVQDEPAVATHVEMLGSSLLARQIVDQMELQDDPEFADLTPLPQKIAQRVEAWLPSELVRQVRVWLPQTGIIASSIASAPPSTEKPADLVQYAVDTLKLRSQVQQVGDSRVISVTVGSYDAGKAARIANAMTALYIEKQLEFRRKGIANAASWMGGRIVDLRSQLSRAENAIASYLQQTGYIESRADNPVLRQMDQLNPQLALAQSDRARAEARMAQIQSLLGSSGGIDNAAKVVASPLLNELRQQGADLNRQMADISKEYGPQHPRLIGMMAALDDLKRREADEVQRVISDLQNEATLALARENQLRAEIEKLNAKATNQQSTALPLRELEREANATDALYKAFLSRQKELEELMQVVDPGVQKVTKATPPLLPSFPNPILFIGGGFVGSTVFALLLGFVAELFDTRMRTEAQLEQVLGLPALAMVPRTPRRQARTGSGLRMVKECPMFAEAMRTVHTELALSHVDRPPRTVLFTSALPGEGKTTVAMGLATVSAMHGQRTMVVDLDLHRPRLSKLVRDAKGQADLVDFLMGKCSLDDIIIDHPEQPDLSFITVRRLPANPSALLASRKMAMLLRDLKERYDLVILDVPPVLAVNDARILAPLADAVLYVIEWEKTTTDAAYAGVKLLKDRNIALAGAVLNHVDLRRHASKGYGDAIQYHDRYKDYYVKRA